MTSTVAATRNESLAHIYHPRFPFIAILSRMRLEEGENMDVE